MLFAPNSADHGSGFTFKCNFTIPILNICLYFGTHFSQMEVQCLALKDLSSPRKSSTVGPEEEDGARGEQKVG